MSRDDSYSQIPIEDLGKISFRIGSKMYVVLNKGGSSVLEDPVTHLPFRTYSKKRADTVADEVGGASATWHEAWAVLEKYYKK